MHYILTILFICLAVQADATAFKQIQKVTQPAAPHMVGDGFKVFNYFPGSIRYNETSPFVLLDYNAPTVFSPSPKRQRGVGAHPHRGFETVTFVYAGAVAHRDSFGGSGVIREGDVQWMTAGSGLLHEELHEKEFSKKGGYFHALQLWVNLPQKDKMSPPKYQTLLDQQMGRFQIDDKGSVLRVVAGRFKGVEGAASTFTPIEIYDLSLKEGAEVSIELPNSYNSMLLVMQGAVEINHQQLANFKDFVLFAHQGELIHLKAVQDSLLIVLSGKPILEPAVQSGPFVMNRSEEIEQAYKDYKAGKFGSI